MMLFNMRKLLQINSVINSGSTGRIAEEIGQITNTNGWESYIAFGRENRESVSQKIKIGTKWNVLWHVLMTRLLDKHGLFSKCATKKLIRQIQQIQPDIVHLHNIHGYYLHYKLLFNYLQKANLPVVWTLHDCWAFTGHCAHFDFVKCGKWKIHCHKCPQKKEYPSAFFRDRSYRNFLNKRESFTLSQVLVTLVPVSHWLADLCSQSFLKNIPIRQIYNGVNIDIFKPVLEEKKKEIAKKYNIKTNFLILGVASIWSERKGLADFIKLSSVISVDSSILLMGLTTKQIKELPEKVIGVERTENIEELVALYSTANVFINPTWEDNFPTTNIEALACGTPVITYNTGGSIEAVTKETGFIVEQGSIQGLISAIEILKQNGKAIYSIECRKRAMKFFNKNDRYAEYLQLYENILRKE
jgi:glycosyltransferase involved in cell wall biosynthesis